MNEDERLTRVTNLTDKIVKSVGEEWNAHNDFNNAMSVTASALCGAIFHHATIVAEVIEDDKYEIVKKIAEGLLQASQETKNHFKVNH